MSISKLSTSYRDGVINGKRKYVIIENGDDTVSFNERTDFIRPEFSVNAGMLNNANSTINSVIDLAELNEGKIADINGDISDLESGNEKAGHALTAVNAGNATSVPTATTADTVENDFILVNRQRLSFTNNACDFYDSRITANSLVDIFFTEETSAIAKAADISVSASNIRVTVTANNTPTGNIIATIKVRTV